MASVGTWLADNLLVFMLLIDDVKGQAGESKPIAVFLQMLGLHHETGMPFSSSDIKAAGIVSGLRSALSMKH